MELKDKLKYSLSVMAITKANCDKYYIFYNTVTFKYFFVAI